MVPPPSPSMSAGRSISTTFDTPLKPHHSRTPTDPGHRITQSAAATAAAAAVARRSTVVGNVGGPPPPPALSPRARSESGDPLRPKVVTSGIGGGGGEIQSPRSGPPPRPPTPREGRPLSPLSPSGGDPSEAGGGLSRSHPSFSVDGTKASLSTAVAVATAQTIDSGLKDEEVPSVVLPVLGSPRATSPTSPLTSTISSSVPPLSLPTSVNGVPNPPSGGGGTTSSAMIVRALYDHVGESEDGELSLVEGARYIVTDSSDLDGWWEAYKEDDPSQKGLVPSNFLQRV